MSLRSTLHYDLHRLREHLGVVRYVRPQEYDVTYRVTVTSTASHDQRMWLVLPVPFDAPYQQITRDLAFSEAPLHESVDETYGNHYAVWTTMLVPHAPSTYEMTFSARVLPREPGYAQPATIPDYANVLKEERELFLRSDRYLDWRDPGVRPIVQEVARGETDVRAVAHLLYEYVRDRLTYGDAILGLHSSHDALTRERVDCGGFDSLLGALYRARGIPARVVAGFWAGYPENTMHAWLEFLTPHNEWIPVDPSMGHLRRAGRTAKSGKFGMVGSDRIALSVGSDIEIRLEPGRKIRVPLLQNPICVAEGGESSCEVHSAFVTHRHE